ncbi:Zinc finger protein zfs1 [Smittium culicis]|uniref:Zinc finger protein zfs1 n=1 Tax=Smittium culicis TaxID=133412 RepID=A0A1R1Y9I0_9FUNG|nr:Zinc finger protein zfs1 [Smittium culicis]
MPSITNKANSESGSEGKINIKQELFKTEQCKNWILYGTCRYGDACKFAHGFVEQRCRDRHNKYKTSLCKDYPLGKCTFGIRCNFAHSTSELITSKNEYKLVPDTRSLSYASKKDPSVEQMEYETLLAGLIKSRMNKKLQAEKSSQAINDLYLNRKVIQNRMYADEMVHNISEGNYSSQLGYLQSLSNATKKYEFNPASNLGNSRLGFPRQHLLPKNEQYSMYKNSSSSPSIDERSFINLDLIRSGLENMTVSNERYLESKISPYFGQKLQSYKNQNNFENKTGILLGSNGNFPGQSPNYNRSFFSNLEISKDSSILDTESIKSLTDSLDDSLDMFSRESSPTRRSNDSKSDYTLGYLESLGCASKKPTKAAF